MFSIVWSNYFRWRRWRFGNILKCIHTFCRAEKSENLAQKFQNKLSFVSENGIFSFSSLSWELHNISHPIWYYHQYLDWYHLQYESMDKRVINQCLTRPWGRKYSCKFQINFKLFLAVQDLFTIYYLHHVIKLIITPFSPNRSKLAEKCQKFVFSLLKSTLAWKEHHCRWSRWWL